MYFSGKLAAILGCFILASMLGYAASVKCWAGGELGEPNFTGYHEYECPTGTVGCITLDCKHSSPFFAKGCNPYAADFTEDQCKELATCDDDVTKIKYPVNKCTYCAGDFCNGKAPKPIQTPQNEVPITAPPSNPTSGTPSFAPDGRLIIGMFFVGVGLLAIMAT